MRLLWLLASLAFVLLLPAPAAASGVAPVEEPVPAYETHPDDTRYFVHAEQPTAAVVVSQRRLPRLPVFAPVATSAGIVLTDVAGSPPICAARPGTFVPACQRLPYRATAPPLR